jgi:cytidylate kinase
MECKSIAIDGPSGAGKSTLARMAADHFGMIYVDTGAIYRCVGLSTLCRDVDSKEAAAVAGILPELNIALRYDGNGIQRMFLNGQDVTDDIRLPEVSIRASDVSAIPAVRDFLLDMQRNMARKYDVIMDGRDIGTVVLPNAGLKIFLTAAVEKRAQRRYEELQAKAVETTFESVLEDMRYRDHNDSSRTTAPLKAAKDAVLLDTSEIGLDESFERLKSIIKERFGK